MKKIKMLLFFISLLDQNHKFNKDLDDLVYKCIDLINNCPNCTVLIDKYYINISTSTSYISLWNSNKWYAWLSYGYVNGRRFEDVRPSRKAMFYLKECLKQKGYNVHVPKPKQTINIEDVKC